jgi:hypothetical protein
MPAAPSITGRAALAAVLMFGFYILALGIAGVLIYIPYAAWTICVHLSQPCGRVQAS